MFPNRDSGGRISVAEDGTFRIAAVNESDAGTYICEALNTKGQVSAKAKIRVVGQYLCLFCEWFLPFLLSIYIQIC